MQPWSFDAAGRFEEHTIASDALRGNPLGDPHERPVWATSCPATTTTRPRASCPST